MNCEIYGDQKKFIKIGNALLFSDDGNNNEDTPGVDYECECTADYFGDHCENGRNITETSK